MYQMQIERYDTLVHLYYGANLGNAEIIHRIVNLDRGFPATPTRLRMTAVFPWMFSPRNTQLRATAITGFKALRSAILTAATVCS